MKTLLLAAGVAALALSVGAVSAASKHPAHSNVAMSPKEPIPYSQLDAYLKASPKQRASMDWSSQGAATTGTSTNTAATASSAPQAKPDAASTETPAAPVNPPAGDPK